MTTRPNPAPETEALLDKQQLNKLYRYALALNKHPDDAYDLLQNAVEKYLQSNNKVIVDTMAFVRTSIRNRFIDECRRKRIVAFESLDALEENDTVAIETMTLEDVYLEDALIETCWAALNNSEREILFFWAVEGYTAAEIAEFTGSPRGTILSKIHRIKKKLAQFGTQTTHSTKTERG